MAHLVHRQIALMAMRLEASNTNLSCICELLHFVIPIRCTNSAMQRLRTIYLEKVYQMLLISVPEEWTMAFSGLLLADVATLMTAV